MRGRKRGSRIRWLGMGMGELIVQCIEAEYGSSMLGWRIGRASDSDIHVGTVILLVSLREDLVLRYNSLFIQKISHGQKQSMVSREASKQQNMQRPNTFNGLFMNMVEEALERSICLFAVTSVSNWREDAYKLGKLTHTTS